MKNLILLLTASILLLACERSMVEPEFEEPLDLEKSELAHQNLAPKKTYVTVDFRGQYSFDPNKGNGDFFSKKAPKYSYETDKERFLRNMKVYTQGTLSMGNKDYKVVNIYNVNKHEILSKKGAVVSGSTWGEFSIRLEDKSRIKEDEYSEKDRRILSQVVSQPKFGPVILSGNFSGSIKGKTIKVKLNGKGHNEMNGAKLVGSELMICGGKFCWNSKSAGKIVKVDYKDE